MTPSAFMADLGATEARIWRMFNNKAKQIRLHEMTRTGFVELYSKNKWLMQTNIEYSLILFRTKFGTTAMA
jgi:hypothetical protein